LWAAIFRISENFAIQAVWYFLLPFFSPGSATGERGLKNNGQLSDASTISLRSMISRYASFGLRQLAESASCFL
jgi:hypothetical protein